MTYFSNMANVGEHLAGPLTKMAATRVTLPNQVTAILITPGEGREIEYHRK